MERFLNSSNKYLYINRFIEQTWNKYYLSNDRLYYIKKLGCKEPMMENFLIYLNVK